MWQIVSHERKMWRHSWVQITGVIVTLIFLLVGVVGTSRPAARAATGDWPTYLGGLSRDGFNGAETIINRTSAPHLKLHWMHKAGGEIASEPVVANGLVYWGSWDGLEHATDPSTGNDLWTANLGQTTSCYTYPAGVITPIGVQSTATIASVPINGVNTTVDFVAGGDAQLYALDASSGGIVWQTRLGSSPSHFLYSSPAVFNGSVYIGVASVDDCPVVQAQMVQLDASTGVIQHVFNVVPNNCLGGAVWGSPAIDTATGMLYFASGNISKCSTAEPYASAVVELNSTDLSVISSWQIPSSQLIQDSDFGSTPTLFQATIGGVQHQMLGVVNKNGIYYALDRNNLSAGPLWETTVAVGGPSPDKGKGSISSSAWDGTALYVATGRTTIQGNSCSGSLRALNPTNGAFLWEFCIPHTKVLAPVIAVPGLVVVVGGIHVYVKDATTGTTLFTFHDSNLNSNFWGAASISNGMLYVGNMDGTLYALGL